MKDIRECPRGGAGVVLNSQCNRYKGWSSRRACERRLVAWEGQFGVGYVARPLASAGGSKHSGSKDERSKREGDHYKK